MNKEIFDEWLKLSKSAVEPMMRLNEITVRAMERVARQQLDVPRSNRAQEFAKIATETQQEVADWAEQVTKKATGAAQAE